MFDQFVAQLQSPDPSQRRKAIIALGTSKDPTALQHLAVIFRTDPEPSLRELARRAGVHIRRAMDLQAEAGQSAAAPPVVSSGDDVDEPDIDNLLGMIAASPAEAPAPETPSERRSAPPEAASVPVRGRTYETSRNDVERAKGYVDQALSMNLKGENAKAMKAMAQALQINPNLINDAYSMSIAASITGLEGDGAVQMILDSSQRKGFEQQALEQKKQRRIETHLSKAEHVTWASTWFEIIIFTIITAVGPVLQSLVTVESARAYVNTLVPELVETPEMQAALASLDQYNAGSLLIVGVVSALAGVIGLLIQTVIIHFGAIHLLGGHGTLRYLLELLLGFYNKWLPIIFFLSYITVAVGFISGFSPIVLCLALPLVLLSLYVSGKTSGKIGEAYDFGTAKGCLAYFIGILVIAVILAAVSIVAWQVLGVSLQNLIPGVL